MRKVLAIFRKDVRSLWPQITIFLCLLAIPNRLWAYWSETQDSDLRFFALVACLPASYYLVAAAMLQESPAGDRQYWLTRPFSARHLLAEKAIFVAVFVNLAMLLVQIAGLFNLGIPPLAHLGALFASQVVICIAILPAAAVFASTRNFRQLLLVGVTVVAGFLWIDLQVPRDWTVPERLAPPSPLAVLVLAAGSVICFHYTRRGALLSWTVLGAMFALVILMTRVEFTPETSTFREVHISLDTAVLRPRIRDFRSRPVEIPLRIEGIPPGVEASAGQARLFISGRSSDGPVVATAPGFAGGKARLIVSARTDSYQTPLHLSGSVEFVMTQRLHSVRVPALGEVVPVPGVGVCTERWNRAGRLTLVCLAPSDCDYLALELPDRSLRWVISPEVAEPHPSVPFLPVVDRFELAGEGGPWETAKTMVTARIVRLRGVFDFPAIRLADYLGPE